MQCDLKINEKFIRIYILYLILNYNQLIKILFKNKYKKQSISN